MIASIVDGRSTGSQNWMFHSTSTRASACLSSAMTVRVLVTTGGAFANLMRTNASSERLPESSAVSAVGMPSARKIVMTRKRSCLVSLGMLTSSSAPTPGGTGLACAISGLGLASPPPPKQPPQCSRHGPQRSCSPSAPRCIGAAPAGALAFFAPPPPPPSLKAWASFSCFLRSFSCRFFATLSSRVRSCSGAQSCGPSTVTESWT